MSIHKQYRLRTISNPDGEIRWYIEMDEDFIDPIKDDEIFVPFGVEGTLTVGNIVTGGTEWNFSLLELGNVLHQIEMLVREAGLRNIR